MFRLGVISTWIPAIAADNFKMQSMWLAAIDVLALLLFIRFIPFDLMLDENETSFLDCCSEVFHSTGQNIYSCEAKSVLDVRKPSQIRFHEQDLVLQSIRAPIDDRTCDGRRALRVRVTLEDASDKDPVRQAAMRERPGTPFDVVDFGNMAPEIDNDVDDELEFEEHSSKQGARQTLAAGRSGRSSPQQAQLGGRDCSDIEQVKL
jgi:hypothetical protein